MENYLKKHIESFFKEITSLNANIFVINSLLESNLEDLKIRFPLPNEDIITSSSSFRDLSQREGGENLYFTNVEYTLSTNNMVAEVNRLRSYIACLTITQVYEAFESFLKNIIAEVIFRNPSKIIELELKLTKNTFEELRRELHSIKGRSNIGYIQILKKTSQFFKKHNEDNIWNRNMSHWLEIIAKVGHLVIHSRLNVSTEFEKYIQEDGRMELFSQYFTIFDVPSGRKLVTTPHNAYSIVDCFFEYAHLIYKSLSIDFQLREDNNFKYTSL